MVGQYSRHGDCHIEMVVLSKCLCFLLWLVSWNVQMVWHNEQHKFIIWHFYDYLVCVQNDITIHYYVCVPSYLWKCMIFWVEAILSLFYSEERPVLILLNCLIPQYLCAYPKPDIDFNGPLPKFVIIISIFRS